MMKNEGNKYDNVIRLIKKNKPEMNHPDIITQKIIEGIKKKDERVRFFDLIMDFFFGWIYVGWVRKSMILAVMFFIVLFACQQAVIIRNLNELSGRRITKGFIFLSGTNEEIPGRINLFRFSGKKLPAVKQSFTKEDVDEMIRSVNKVQMRYRDLLDQIKDNPELKSYLETRLNETGK